MKTHPRDGSLPLLLQWQSDQFKCLYRSQCVTSGNFKVIVFLEMSICTLIFLPFKMEVLGWCGWVQEASKPQPEAMWKPGLSQHLLYPTEKIISFIFLWLASHLIREGMLTFNLFTKTIKECIIAFIPIELHALMQIYSFLPREQPCIPNSIRRGNLYHIIKIMRAHLPSICATKMLLEGSRKSQITSTPSLWAC